MCDQHQITPARRDPSSLRAAGPREADLGLGAGGGRAEQEAVAQRTYLPLSEACITLQVPQPRSADRVPGAGHLGARASPAPYYPGHTQQSHPFLGTALSVPSPSSEKAWLAGN